MIIVNDCCHVCYYNVLLCAVVAPPVGYNVLRCRQEWNGTEIVAYLILYMLQCNTKTTLYTHRQTVTRMHTNIDDRHTYVRMYRQTDTYIHS